MGPSTNRNRPPWMIIREVKLNYEKSQRSGPRLAISFASCSLCRKRARCRSSLNLNCHRDEVRELPEELGRAEIIMADNGYMSETNVEQNRHESLLSIRFFVQPKPQSDRLTRGGQWAVRALDRLGCRRLIP